MTSEDLRSGEIAADSPLRKGFDQSYTTQELQVDLTVDPRLFHPRSSHFASAEARKLAGER